jgi:hypothetical protein
MAELKIRKIGNSLGSIFPKSWHLKEGEKLLYYFDQAKHRVIINLNDQSIEDDRKLIEDAFADFAKDDVLTDQQIAEEFKQYGWEK